MEKGIAVAGLAVVVVEGQRACARTMLVVAVVVFDG